MASRPSRTGSSRPPGRREAPDARAAARHHGPRARARNHHQAQRGPDELHRRGRRDLRAQPHRHPGARGLHLRGLPLAGRVRGRDPGGGRVAGRPGADAEQPLSGDGRGSRDHPGPQQDRSARRRAREAGAGDHGPDRGQAGGDPGRLGQGGDRRPGAARGDRGPGAAAARQRGGAAPRPHLRFVLRPLPRRDPEHPGGGRHGARGDGDRLRRPPGRRLPRGRGRATSSWASIPRPSSRPARWDTSSPACAACATRAWATPSSTRTTARAELLPGLPRREVDGVRRHLPDRLRPVRGPARRAREAGAQRRQPPLRARVVHRARLRVPLRLPRPAAHGDRAGAARARVQPRA